jgi:iron complex outermembrane receptor protein
LSVEDFKQQTVTDGTAQFRDIDVLHNGVEVETTYRPFNALKLTGMVSVGDWRYTKDFSTALFDEIINNRYRYSLY